MVTVPVITTPFERVAIDIVGPLPMTARKKRFILTIMDMATRYPEAKALRRVDTQAILKPLINFFSRFGFPAEILSDRGSNFTSKLMKEVTKRLKIEQVLASPYHPESNGALERWHSTLKAMMRKSGKGRTEWDQLLPMLLFAYREAVHEATGFSPFHLLFGREVRGPLDIVKEQWEGKEVLPVSIVEYLSNLYDHMETIAEIAGSEDEKAKKKYKQWYDRSTTEHSFEVGEHVLVLMPDGTSKLEAAYMGPYVILEQVSPVTYRVDLKSHGGRVVHTNLLKKWTTPTATAMAVAIIQENECPDEGDIVTVDLDTDEVPRFSNDLSSQDKKEATSLVLEFKEVFSNTPGRTQLAEHGIRTGEAAPIRAPTYRIPIAYINQVHEELKKMQELGIIEPSHSPWSAPLVAVRKKDGKVRICGYRRLNVVTDNDPYVMPRMEELLDQMGRARFFSTLDMLKGYYQVPMNPDDKQKTAFSSPLGKYEFSRMPFGLKNAPATFQRLVDSLFDGTQRYIVAYIDDVGVYSHEWVEHLQHLREALNRIQGAGLTLRPDKCLIGASSCEFLGHKVGGGVVRPLEAKVEAVTRFSRPTTKQDVRAFLGLTGYTDVLYRNMPKEQGTSHMHWAENDQRRSSGH